MTRALLLLLFLAAPASADLLQPENLAYQGAFLAPGWRPGARWGAGLDALTYNPERGTLIGSAHAVQFPGYVGEMSVPALRVPSGGSTAGIERAADVFPFVDVGGSFRQELSDTGLDRFGGLELLDGRLYWCFYRYYAVQPLNQIDDPTFGSEGEGLWRAGDFHQKLTSNYMTTIPEDWANQHVQGHRLLVGKGDGAGAAGNSQGPALFAVNAQNFDEAARLLYYPSDHPVVGRSACDRWEGLVWVYGDKEAVMVAGTRGLGPDRYGRPVEGDCSTDKGYHCDPYGARVLLYSPDDLADVVEGTRPSHVQPYVEIDLDPVFASASDRCYPGVGAAAYDHAGKRVFIVQSNGENPIIHVWKVTSNITPPPIPDPDPLPPPPDDTARRLEELEAQVQSLNDALADLQKLAEEIRRLGE